jgi:hypothetical protein
LNHNDDDDDDDDDDDGGRTAINPDKFDKLIASLRTAVDVGGTPYI